MRNSIVKWCLSFAVLLSLTVASPVFASMSGMGMSGMGMSGMGMGGMGMGGMGMGGMGMSGMGMSGMGMSGMGMAGMAEALSAREMAGMGMAGPMRDAYYGRQKVAYHVNFYDAKKQTAALRNIQNHINAVGAENLDLKVVMHGDGVSLVIDPDFLPQESKMKEANANADMQARIAGLKQQGVDFQICANTLRGRIVPREALYDTRDSDIVPSGVAELSRLQQMGYTYIKP